MTRKKQRARASRKYTSCVVVAVRLRGLPGWQLLMVADLALLKTVWADLNWDVVDLSIVRQDAWPAPSSAKVLGLKDSYDIFSSHLWTFDERRNCWLPEGEVLDPPDQAPVRVDDVRFHFGLPEAGWVDFTVEAAEQRQEFHLSNVFEPFDDMVKWLELLVAGGEPRLIIDEEGSHKELHVFTAAEDIRFATAKLSASDVDGSFHRTWPVNVSCSRQTLVRSFARDFTKYWTSSELRERWTEWEGAETVEERVFLVTEQKDDPRPYDHLGSRLFHINRNLGALGNLDDVP